MAPYALSAASGRRSTSIGDLDLASPGSRSASLTTLQPFSVVDAAFIALAMLSSCASSHVHVC